MHVGDVLPACAGMILLVTLPPRTRRSIPRVCGDEPYADDYTVEIIDVFSACAGMSLVLGSLLLLVSCIPSVSGDEPGTGTT